MAAYKNDLLKQNWTPAQPMLLCGGNADPTVFYNVNTQGAQAYFASKGVPAQAVMVLDVDTAPTAGDGFDAARAGFGQAKSATATAAMLDEYRKREAAEKAGQAVAAKAGGIGAGGY